MPTIREVLAGISQGNEVRLYFAGSWLEGTMDEWDSDNETVVITTAWPAYAYVRIDSITAVELAMRQRE
jgi:hypothetical protein